jgi:hypothetical protein
VGFRGAIVGVSPHCFRDPAAAYPGENRLIFNVLSVAAHTTTTIDCPPRKLKAIEKFGPGGCRSWRPIWSGGGWTLSSLKENDAENSTFRRSEEWSRSSLGAELALPIAG